jgi:glycosyltransferase involved in cell wall biosynthesis
VKAVFLYTELADYFIRCCEVLSQSCEVHIVRWPVNREAPFRFAMPPQIRVYDKGNYTAGSLQKLVEEIDPDFLYCSGWIDRDYLSVVRKHKRNIPKVMGCDTQWRGSLKQRLAVLAGRFYLQRIFTHVWVPGERQERYVRKMGFKGSRVRSGFYCCDLARFNEAYERTREQKSGSLPRRFVFSGRYYAFKGLTDLLEAFTMLGEEGDHGWELWCLGTGDIKPPAQEGVRHHGFVQPDDLQPILAGSAVFVLPSRFEPWGVVVQEFAAAGFPLLLSDEVGAADAFLDEPGNGFRFRAGDPRALKATLKKIMNLSDKDLLLMGRKSHELAQRISPQQWAGTVTEIVGGFRKN